MTTVRPSRGFVAPLSCAGRARHRALHATLDTIVEQHKDVHRAALTGKTIIITGSSPRRRRRHAQILAAEGAQHRRELPFQGTARANKIVKAIEEAGGKAVAVAG